MKKQRTRVRHVKASREEMAYEPPVEIDFSKGVLIRGLDNWRRFRKWKKHTATLTPTIRAAFPNDQLVNQALQMVLELRSVGSSPKRKKSA